MYELKIAASCALSQTKRFGLEPETQIFDNVRTQASEGYGILVKCNKFCSYLETALNIQGHHLLS